MNWWAFAGFGLLAVFTVDEAEGAGEVLARLLTCLAIALTLGKALA